MPDKLLEHLGSCLREARKSRGLSQERLSDASGVSTRHIAKIENAEINPSFEKLSALVNTLGMSFDVLFFADTNDVETDLNKLSGLYRACSPEGRRLMMSVMDALANELMAQDQSASSNNQIIE